MKCHLVKAFVTSVDVRHNLVEEILDLAGKYSAKVNFYLDEELEEEISPEIAKMTERFVIALEPIDGEATENLYITDEVRVNHIVNAFTEEQRFDEKFEFDMIHRLIDEVDDIMYEIRLNNSLGRRGRYFKRCMLSAQYTAPLTIQKHYPIFKRNKSPPIKPNTDTEYKRNRSKLLSQNNFRRKVSE